MLALLSIQTAQKSATAFAVTVPVFAFALPMLDTTLVIIRRFLSRQPIFVGDRRHLHHALLERGFSPKSAVILLYAIAGLLGLVSLLFLNPAGKTMGLAFAMLGVCVVVGIQRLRIPELRALHVYMSRHLRHQRELVASSVAMRQAMDHFDTASSSQELFASLEGALQQSTFSRAVLRLRDGLAATNARNVPGSASEDQTWIWTRQNSRPVGAEWQMVFPLHVGTLTLYHEQNAEYPVSAICWLGQGMTLELERAWHRVQASQARQHAVLRPSSRRPRTVMPALARRNRWPAAQTDAPANA
jgi:hypothetical protein